MMISKEPSGPHTLGESLKLLKMLRGGTSLEVQGLGLRASTLGVMGLIPGGGTNSPQAAWCPPFRKKMLRGDRAVDGASRNSPSAAVCSQTGSLHSPVLFRSGRNPRT